MSTGQINYKKSEANVGSLLVLLIGSEMRTYCYWCGQKLNNCEACKGKGVRNNSMCERCNGTGVLCATHDKMWD